MPFSSFLWMSRSILFYFFGYFSESLNLMGGCLSRRSVYLPTAKLVVLQRDAGGLIKEFTEPVKVAEILREMPDFFVCHADSMRYDQYVSPLSAEQELQVEHLYFLLPLTKLRHPLAVCDMAALAVEASAAMERSRRCYNKLGRRRCKIMPNLMMMEQEVADHMSHHQIKSSSYSWSGEFKRGGYDSETLECRRRVEVDFRPRSVDSQLQRRKRVRKKLSTIHEEAFAS